MLDRNTAEELVILISNEKDPLKTIYKYFCNFDLASKVLSQTTLAFLLQFNLLNSHQTVAALWILYSETKSIPLSENQFAIVYTNLYQNFSSNISLKNEAILTMLKMILNGESIDSLANKNTSAILLNKLNPPENPELHITTQSKPFYQSVFAVEEEISDVSEKSSLSDVLVTIMTSDNLFIQPHLGPDTLPPPLLPIEENELLPTFIPDREIHPLFDDAPKSMIYEPIESIISRMNRDKLKRREAELVLDAVKQNISLVRFLWDDRIRAQDFITVNKYAARIVYCYIASIDQSIFDTLLIFEVTKPVMMVICDMILVGNFPFNFVENMTDVILDKLRKSDKKELLEKRAAAFFGMMCELFVQKVSFSDYVIGELRDFIEEGTVNDIVEAQDLFAFLTEN